jgi:hypothetical protein
MRWNGLNRSATLQLGERLHLTAPQAITGGPGSTTVAPATH